MQASELKQGHSYRFEVDKNLSNRKYFKISTDDGRIFSLLKFKFQQNIPLPDYIDCYVKSLVPDIILGQDISVFINKFYSENQEYDFTVKGCKKIENTDDNQYELEDAHGLCFKLFNAPKALTKGCRVKCRIMRIRGVKVSLKYVGTLSLKFPLVFQDISQWLNALDIINHHYYYLRILESVPEFHTALSKYDDGDASWILDTLQASAEHITDWLIANKDNLTILQRLYRLMETAHSLALYILEGSDYLRTCNNDQRTLLQSKLSNYVELFSQYRQATKKILDKTDEEYIDRMFSRLKEAGYLYNPSRQFRIMMTILKLRPELISSRMGELFEALHNWDLTNWQSDPFRPALVQQLQIFIEENAEVVNILPANDSSEDNKVFTRMILAIAVQKLLATETDNIDLDLNRAMLYRYISCLNPNSVNTLLRKSIDSLLGIDIPNEFTWNDTDQPTLLFEKASHPFSAQEESSNVCKNYSTPRANVKLHSDALNIIARNANQEDTVIPNGIFDWLNIRISLNDNLTGLNIRKMKDLRSFRKMWEDISWSIFGGEKEVHEIYEKTLPYDDTDTRVIIDKVRINKDAPERQRLQFHCTIFDDLYYGDGWMPCDAIHMFGWLTDKDVPGNYDMSLNFARTEDGTPLLFNATVYHRNGELEFSMKSQIEDFLVENMYSGQEFIAIVTYLDRINNLWLCLAENGATFKVPCDEISDNLGIYEGKLVRVKYIEQEYSSSVTLFYIGELSDYQEDIPFAIKKQLCLTNLMRNLGESSDENFNNTEVVEIDEVMSKEELMQLIYIFQRRAYSETEYIKAFNSLGIAFILCKVAEESDLLKEINTHMDLLVLLQDFGRNQKIDIAELEKCADKVKSSPMLERIFTRLKIVAEIDKNDNSDWLWQKRQNPRNDTEGSLAALVLSYNMLPKELEQTRADIMNSITTLLNVNNTASKSKYYGDESQTVEFKSSLIFSTHGGGKPDPEGQMHEIIHIICGFMNARGGTLYIGVNDSGYENGLDDDLAFRRSHGQKANLDGMIIDLQNQLDRKIPASAKDHCDIRIDSEAKKGVIVVSVEPVREPVELDGIIYVRQSSSTKPRNDIEREEFIRNRPHNYEVIMASLGIRISKEEEISASDKSSARSLQVDGQSALELPATSHNESATSHNENFNNTDESGTYYENDTDIPQDEEEKTFLIKTGRHRLNILHENENNFASPLCYIYFLDGNRFYTSAIDEWKECPLVLAVNEKEKDSNIILTYADGNIVRLPMQQFVSTAQGERISLRKDMALEHVNIANSYDYLLSVIKAPFGGLFYRIDKISSIPEASGMDAKGHILYDQRHHILAQEIISYSKLSFFKKDAVGKDHKSFGISLPLGDGTLSEEERIKRFLDPVAHTE